MRKVKATFSVIIIFVGLLSVVIGYPYQTNSYCEVPEDCEPIPRG